MKISIYKEANYVPTTKEEKRALAFKTSSPNVPTILEVANEEELIAAISSFAWSPSIFSGVRLDENFISTDFMALDIDDGMTISQAENRVQQLGLCALCLPSPSHTEEQNKFRLVFPLAKTIFSHSDYDATWNWLAEKFPELDRQCSDSCRWYAASKLGDGFWQDGDFLLPQKAKEEEKELEYSREQNLVAVPENLKEQIKLLYGKDRESCPESVEFFLTNAHTGLSGLWVNSLNSCCFSLALSGVSDILIEEMVESVAPEPLTKIDEYQIKRAIRDGKRYRDQNL
jgi:hypothetical protein